MTTCQLCGSAVKLIPSGVSKKTGKEYQAFYACENKTCGKTYQSQATGIPAKAMENVAKKTEDQKWNEISTGKVRHGVACEFIKLGAELNSTTINKINAWTDYIMTGKAFTSAPDEIIVDDMPF